MPWDAATELFKTLRKLARSVVLLRASLAYDLEKKINKHDRGKHPIDRLLKAIGPLNGWYSL
jgi:hypothetical protein